jgi:hypothetical protein
MADTRFTHALQTLLHKTAAVVEGLPTDLVDTLKIGGTLVADVAAIKQELTTGNYAAVVPSVVSDVTVVKGEIVTLKTAIAQSLATAASQSDLQAVTASVANAQSDVSLVKTAIASLQAEFATLKANVLATPVPVLISAPLSPVVDRGPMITQPAIAPASVILPPSLVPNTSGVPVETVTVHPAPATVPVT